MLFDVQCLKNKAVNTLTELFKRKTSKYITHIYIFVVRITFLFPTVTNSIYFFMVFFLCVCGKNRRKKKTKNYVTTVNNKFLSGI